MNRKHQLAWAAGFIDGEGCIMIVRNTAKTSRGVYYTLRINVAQNDPRPLEILSALFGGNVRKRKVKSPLRTHCWEWTISTMQAAHALQQMLPYLVVKREQAEIAIRFAGRRPESRFTQLSDKQFAQDERDFEEIRAIRY
jgi:hypothetical protein